MTQDDIIRMALEAGLSMVLDDEGEKVVERFAVLVAAHERNRHAWTQEHWTEYEHAIAAAEREACAKVCDTMATPETSRDAQHDFHWAAGCCAAAIRSRSNEH